MCTVPAAWVWWVCRGVDLNYNARTLVFTFLRALRPRARASDPKPLTSTPQTQVAQARLGVRVAEQQQALAAAEQQKATARAEAVAAELLRGEDKAAKPKPQAKVCSSNAGCGRGGRLAWVVMDKPRGMELGKKEA